MPHIVSDGSGNFFIVYLLLASSTYDIYLQKIDSNGQLLLSSNGVAVSTASGDQGAGFPEQGDGDAVQAISDGSGGLFIVWSDDRNGGVNSDIYAQRVNSSGTSLWDSNGKAIIATSNSDIWFHMISDGSTGFIVATETRESGLSNIDILAQKVNSSGTLQWGSGTSTTPLTVSTTGSLQIHPQCVSDGSGGAIIMWTYLATTWDIVGRRVSSAGSATVWGSSDVAIASESSNQLRPIAISDGAGGAIVCYMDNTSGNYDLLAKRVNSSGALVWSSATTICNASGNQPAYLETLGTATEYLQFVWHNLMILAADSNYFAIIWDDPRDSSNTDIYAQLIDLNGQTQWTSNGLAIASASGSQGTDQFDVRAVKSDSSTHPGIFVAWSDSRNSARDIYCQKVNTPGGSLGQPSTPSNLSISATSNTELAVTWSDNSSIESGFKLQRSTDNTNFTEISSLSSNTTSYNDTGLSEGTIYYYKVNAFLTGAANSSFTSSTSKYTKLNPPTNVKSTVVGNTWTSLTWTNNSPKATTTTIERSTDGVNFSQIGSVAANITSYDDLTAKESTQYHYRVMAKNSNTTSAYASSSSSVTTITSGSKRIKRRCPMSIQPQPSHSSTLLLSLLSTLLILKLIRKLPPT
jgi:hypothetical protein